MSVDNLAARNEVARLFEAYAKLFNSEQPAEDAWAAYEAAAERHRLSILVNEQEDAVVRCAISGAPILEDDEIVTVLKSALPTEAFVK